MNVLLIGPSGHGGEGIYVNALEADPPTGVDYDVSADFHRSARHAHCLIGREVALNRLVHRLAMPDIGMRALSLDPGYDLVHVHAHPVYLRGLRDTPLVMSEGSCSAVYLGDYLGWSKRHLASAYARSRRLYRAVSVHDRLLALSAVRRVYVFSQWAREINIRWGADPAKLSVIYPGFDIPVLPQRPTQRPFTFLFVGTDFERKGGYDVVEAFARLSAEIEDVRLLLAGFDPHMPNPDLQRHAWVSPSRRAAVSELLSGLIAGGRAKLIGPVSHEHMVADVFPAADAFVMPTLAEGFGFVLVEAMSFALPVITSDVGPAREIVDPGRTGTIVPPANVQNLTEAMGRLATHPGLASELGRAGRERFLRQFTRERFRDELGKLYREAVEAG
jgi:glycosyltransferase involved in cell wall biosynthesis